MKSSADLIEATSLSTGVLILLLVIWLVLIQLMRVRGLSFLTEGSLAAIMGLTAGISLLVVQHYQPNRVLWIKDLTSFDSSIFLVYLLPPIIFHCGLGMEKKLFFENLGTIFCMGILGTVISFVIISLFMYTFAEFHVLRLQDCLALGAIFSATDSVATLQVLNAQEMPLLFSLVFGEGVINDATSVVLLGAVGRGFSPASNGGGGSPDSGEVHPNSSQQGLGVIFSFLYLMSTSLVLGLVTGLTIAFLLRRFEGLGAYQELALVGTLSYLSYLIAEVSGLSGILSLFCCGVVVSQWVLPTMSRAGASATATSCRTLSHLAEGIVFIYVGMDALDPVKWKAASPSEAFLFCLALLVLLLISRALGVIPMALLHNLWGSPRLSNSDLFIIWWSGLGRGAVSVALVYYYFDNHALGLSHVHRATVIVSTLVIVLFTTVLFGVLTKPLLNLALALNEPDQSLLKAIRERMSAFQAPSFCNCSCPWTKWIHLTGYRRVEQANDQGQEGPSLTQVAEMEDGQASSISPSRPTLCPPDMDMVSSRHSSALMLASSETGSAGGSWNSGRRKLDGIIR